MRFRIGDESQVVLPGSTWAIPSHVPHEVEVGPDGCVVVEVFAPRRDDWTRVERDEPRAPRWP
jgi:quercetin dioxygenase-like cupin family protein